MHFYHFSNLALQFPKLDTATGSEVKAGYYIPFRVSTKLKKGIDGIPNRLRRLSCELNRARIVAPQDLVFGDERVYVFCAMMASVAYNFMSVDPNAHARRYHDDPTNQPPQRVTVEVRSETGGVGSSRVKKRNRKKSSSTVSAQKQKVSFTFVNS